MALCLALMLIMIVQVQVELINQVGTTNPKLRRILITHTVEHFEDRDYLLVRFFGIHI